MNNLHIREIIKQRRIHNEMKDLWKIADLVNKYPESRKAFQELLSSENISEEGFLAAIFSKKENSLDPKLLADNKEKFMEKKDSLTRDITELKKAFSSIKIDPVFIQKYIDLWNAYDSIKGEFVSLNHVSLIMTEWNKLIDKINLAIKQPTPKSVQESETLEKSLKYDSGTFLDYLYDDFEDKHGYKTNNDLIKILDMSLMILDKGEEFISNVNNVLIKRLNDSSSMPTDVRALERRYITYISNFLFYTGVPGIFKAMFASFPILLIGTARLFQDLSDLTKRQEYEEELERVKKYTK